jgi:hypothetical protein
MPLMPRQLWGLCMADFGIVVRHPGRLSSIRFVDLGPDEPPVLRRGDIRTWERQHLHGPGGHELLWGAMAHGHVEDGPTEELAMERLAAGLGMTLEPGPGLTPEEINYLGRMWAFDGDVRRAMNFGVDRFGEVL